MSCSSQNISGNYTTKATGAKAEKVFVNGKIVPSDLQDEGWHKSRGIYKGRWWFCFDTRVEGTVIMEYIAIKQK